MAGGVFAGDHYWERCEKVARTGQYPGPEFVFTGDTTIQQNYQYLINSDLQVII